MERPNSPAVEGRWARLDHLRLRLHLSLRVLISPKGRGPTRSFGLRMTMALGAVVVSPDG